ncbi:unnamed protein product [marine sediment metagenome]|uniref:SnoaL-like domain-containing protein n=1 Tax=marine sediment metagenome TaxID=412755 RepID=X1BVZ5_9ZZZZ
MSLEENKEIVRRWIESYNKHNLDSLDEFLAPDYIDHIHHGGPEGVKQVFNMAFNAFPDWHESIEEMIAEGDTVWARLTYSGTHTGEFFGLPATGNKITATAVAMYRIVDGKLVEGRFITDSLNMNKQMGAIEFTEKGKALFPEDNE